MTKGSGELILVVEDELAVRLAVVESLRWMNYQVLQAADGGEALSILTEKGNRVQLILSDVVMPEMGGIALFHAVREQELNIPVILLTGHPKETELEVLQEQGLAGWLLKPPNMEQLAQMVAQAITEK
jgi:CheY-like chemotaxis protein